MLPFLHIGSVQIPTFGLLLWLAMVVACWVLHRNFVRHHVLNDALNVAALTTLAGIAGAKLWHELQSPSELASSLHSLAHTLKAEPGAFPGALLNWAQAGFAWFGGLLAGVFVLAWIGRRSKLTALGMLDLATPAAAVGYAVGRIGCLISGDGDYGVPTNHWWGMAFPHGLVPTDPGVKVQPTPIFEFLFGAALAWYLWVRGKRATPLGQLTGEFLLISGVGRFLVEFIRINPRLYWGMSNAQVASLATAFIGFAVVLYARRRNHTLAVPAAPAGVAVELESAAPAAPRTAP